MGSTSEDEKIEQRGFQDRNPCLLRQQAKYSPIRRHWQTEWKAAAQTCYHTGARKGNIHTGTPLNSAKDVKQRAVHLDWFENPLITTISIPKDLRFIMTDLNMHLKNYIRDIPNFPIPGIMFRDITTLLVDADAFKQAIDGLLAPYRGEHIDKVVVIESRGFIFGAPMAYELGAGVVPVRKPGKLPSDTITEHYSLEYGTNTLQLHTDAISAGERVIIVDDLLATGGTVDASIKLVQSLGGEIVGVSFLAELIDLKGRERVTGVPLHSLVHYD